MVARWREINERDAWRLYMAESMRLISESTAKFAGGPYMTAKWADIINLKDEKQREPGEIAAEVIKNAGLVVVA